MLHFQLQYIQPLIQHYKQSTVREVPLQSIQSLWKIWVTYIFGRLSDVIPCAVNKEKWSTKKVYL